MKRFGWKILQKKWEAEAEPVRLFLGARSLFLAVRRVRTRKRHRLVKYHTLRCQVIAGFYVARITSWANPKLAHVTATFISLLVVAFMLWMGGFGKETKVAEFSLAAAGIIGAALALVLSLSIIPAQRASESFAMPIVTKLANDKLFRFTFVGLVSTTLLSLLLGTNWSEFFSAKLSLSAQFVLLGVSFDILRAFYSTTLTLLLPESAVRRLVKEVKVELRKTSRAADRVLAVQSAMTDGAEESKKIIHALAIQKAKLPNALSYWSDQLEEAAHRFISRRDSNATIEAINALELIGREYAELRKKSVNLHIDPAFVFSGPQSDITTVQGPIYESLLRILEDAIDAKNERVVTRVVDSIGRLAEHSLSVVAMTNYHAKIAPLAFSGVYYLDRAIKAVLTAKMLDATLHGVTAIESILLKRDATLDLTGVAERAYETLVSVAVAGYTMENGSVVVLRSIEAMLTSAQYEIANDFALSTLPDLLNRLWLFFGFEVAADRMGQRKLLTYPLFNLGSPTSLPFLLQDIALKAKPDIERPHFDPYSALSTNAQAVRGFFRNLGSIKFGDILLHKWAIDTFSKVCRVLFNQITHPLEGAENFTGVIVNDLTSLLSWIAGLFHEDEKSSHVRDATHALAVLGIDALAYDQSEVAMACVNAISAIGSCVVKADIWAMADAHCDLEVIARAAESKGDAILANYARSRMTLPSTNVAGETAARSEAVQNRIRHLDEAVRTAGRRSYRIGDDPVEHLYNFINQQGHKRS